MQPTLAVPPRPPLPEIGPELEAALGAVETQLASLGEALRERRLSDIESHASELHRALSQAVNRFAHAARAGGVPAPLRRRFAVAGGQVAAQRESLARATAALDRAIDVLLPRDAAVPVGAIYSAASGSDRGINRNGYLQA